MPEFRKYHPGNTCDKVYQNYRSYKNPWLIEDFKHRCGYCNDHDFWAGGRRGMQIDHFAPKKKFPEHSNDYVNLVYSCFYCNNHKSDDWVTDSFDQSFDIQSNTGYVHPREVSYAATFRRTDSGKIIPMTDVGKYMFRQLCLGLKRHELIYILEELESLWCQLNELSIVDGIDTNQKEILKERRKSISDEFMEYLLEYKETINC